MNVIERIHQLRLERGWSVNNLAMEAGMTQSTLNSILSRNSPPKIETLQLLCNAFKITLAQFFMDDEQLELVNANEKELLMSFRRLRKLLKKYKLFLTEKPKHLHGAKRWLIICCRERLSADIVINSQQERQAQAIPGVNTSIILAADGVDITDAPRHRFVRNCWKKRL